MPSKRGRRSRAGAERHRMRGVEHQLMLDARARSRDPRDPGLDANRLSRMTFNEDAAAKYTADSRIKDTRDGVMVKGRRVGRRVGVFWRDAATQRELVGSTAVPDDLMVSAEVWDAETDTRKRIMVPAALKPLAEPPSAETRPMTPEEQYRLRAW